MIHILLLILKLVGIILLSILIIAFTLILLVLFVPVNYQIHAEYGKDSNAIIKISWLLHILSGKIYYDGDSNAIFKFFGIPVYDANRNEEIKGRREKQKKEKSNKKKSTVKAETNKKKKEIIKETEPNQQIKMQIEAKIETDKISDLESYQENSDTENIVDGKIEHSAEGNGKSSKIRTFIKKVKDLWSKILNVCKNIKYTFERIYDKIRDICNNINYYFDLAHSVEAKKAYILCKKQIIYLWKNIKPKKYKVYLHVGNEDPSVTGEIMALYGMLYPFYTNHVMIVPEFEQNILEGNLSIKGKITIFVIVRVLWMVYFDKNLKSFLSMLKKED